MYDLEYLDLINFIEEYNRYVADYPETHDEGCYPVCVGEFFDNEYQEILKENQ